MIRSLGFFLTFSFFVSCIDHQSIINEVVIITVKPDPLKGIPDAGPVRFDTPAIGRRSYYVYFEAEEDHNTKVVNYEYSTDTLVMAVTGKKNNQWVIKDFLTPGSNSIQTKTGTFKYDSVFVTLLDIDSDSLAFTRPASDIYSTYFFAFNSARFVVPLSQIAEPAPQNPTCSPFLFFGSDTMAYALNYTQLGQTFDHLNIYMDYSRVEVDGGAITYVYEPPYGFVRTTWFNPLLWDAAGWDLIPR